ncbi:hypothetical protein GOODEAATRI_019188 [Goodea atripinnis]|uniref:Neuronal PAS domain protein 4 n=1 Tax=Goodea atripinnis TaxID=208336 RepID=A0ABV0NLH6_9TELE
MRGRAARSFMSVTGASKARRDQINAEIRNLKDLLPISDADKARLSYLHIMSLACMYTRKSVFFTQEAGSAGSLEERAAFLSFHELSELMEALPGFLMLLTGEGKLLYLSDSVSEHLGHSMVDLVAQGDSVYDIIDAADHFIMRTKLSVSTSLEMDRLFRCRFNTSKSVRRQSAGNKLVLIRARCLASPSTAPTASSYWTTNPVWVCFCTPLEPQPTRSGCGAERDLASAPPLAETNLFLACFHSQHGRDMRLQVAQDSSEQTQLTLVLSAGTSQQEGLSLQSPETLSSPDQVFTPGDGDCTVMTLPEVRGPLYVDVPLGPLQFPPEGLLTPEASPGKHPCLSFFSVEREKERAEISLLAQHISSLAEGFYMDPLLSKLSPPSLSPSSSPPSPFLSPAIEPADQVQMLREFYPIKTWRGLDIPIFLDDDESLFEESILETLLQDDFAPPQTPNLSALSPLKSPMSDPSGPTSPQTPVCWHQLSQFEGVGHICSVQSAQSNSMAGCGATVAAEAGVKVDGEGLAEEAMEIEVVSSPVSSCSSIPASPPLLLTASPSPTTSTPVASPTPAVSCTQSLLEELAVLEPMFGAGASIAPGLGQQPELYQLQCHPSPQCFHKDGSGSVPPF